MESTLFVCVDGGGTKTEALLCDAAGRVLGIGRAEGSNALSVGKEKAVSAVLETIRGALGGVPAERVGTARLFIPGFAHCLPLALPFETLVLGDAANAYFGALGAPDGIALLSGTGSFATTYNARGEETSVGGWGPMLGDEGSGYDVGRRAVRGTLADFDEGKPPSPLGRAVLRHYGVESAACLVHAIYHAGCDREHMAQLCPVVGEHARAKEPDALAILRDTANALCALAATLKARAALECPLVALTGGVSGLGDALTCPLRDALDAAGMTLIAPRRSPSVGGILYTYWALTGQMPPDALADAYDASYKTMKGSQTPC